jgi:predicted dehydrogenase
MKAPLTMVGIGCGHRTLTYCGLAAKMQHRYRVVGGADPVAVRVEKLSRLSGDPAFRSFVDAEALLAAGRIADLAVIGTQDNYHVGPAVRAMELGYDLLLEKPIAPDPRQVLELLAVAERLGRKVLVCHVLRYTPFYEKVQELLVAGAIGDIASIDASEGVGDFHQVHSFVRGHWARSDVSNPMIVAKSCHDMDIISWLVGRPCQRVASFGGLHHFTAAKAPAGAPARCTDGCPVGDSCRYNALRYIDRERGWLSHVMDGGDTASPEAVRAHLAHSPWGRCAWRCDNDVVDRQVVAFEFAGGIAGTFTMTAFDSGRNVTIRGTTGVLTGGDALHARTGDDIVVRSHAGAETRYRIQVDAGGYAGHGGGDPGLVNALDRELAKPAGEMRTGLSASVESHMMGFAAEESRRSGRVVDLAEFRSRHAIGAV